jgi:hypothetical protein
MTRAIAVALLVMTACAHHRVTYVELAEVHEHLMALRAHGTAKVDALESDRDSGNGITAMPRRRMTVWIDFDRAVVVDGRTLTLRQLADGCPTMPPAPLEELPAPCGLFVYRDTRFQAGASSRWTHNSYMSLATGLLGLAAGGGAIYCGLECESWPRAKTAGLGVSSAVLLLAWAVYGGGRD